MTYTHNYIRTYWSAQLKHNTTNEMEQNNLHTHNNIRTYWREKNNRITHRRNTLTLTPTPTPTPTSTHWSRNVTTHAIYGSGVYRSGLPSSSMPTACCKSLGCIHTEYSLVFNHKLFTGMVPKSESQQGSTTCDINKSSNPTKYEVRPLRMRRISTQYASHPTQNNATTRHATHLHPACEPSHPKPTPFGRVWVEKWSLESLVWRKQNS